MSSFSELWDTVEPWENKSPYIPDGTFTAVIKEAGLYTNPEDPSRKSIFFKLYSPEHSVEETAWFTINDNENSVKKLKTALDRLGLLPCTRAELVKKVESTVGWVISAYKSSKPKENGEGHWRNYYFNEVKERKAPATEVEEDSIPF